MLGQKIKELREGLCKLNQFDFGEKIGMSKSSISMIENDERGLDFDQLQMLCKMFKLDARYFFDPRMHIEHAVLSDREDEALSPFEKIEKRLEELQTKIIPINNRNDPACRAVSEKPELKNLVMKLINWDEEAICRLSDISTGFAAGQDFEKIKKESPRKAKNA